MEVDRQRGSELLNVCQTYLLSADSVVGAQGSEREVNSIRQPGAVDQNILKVILQMRVSGEILAEEFSLALFRVSIDI